MRRHPRIKAVIPTLLATILLSPVNLSQAAVYAADSISGNRPDNPSITTAIASTEEAITVASELRMLSQRIYKSYVFLGLNIRARKADHDLKDAINRFDSGLARLMSYARNESQQIRCAAVSKAWHKLRPIYLSRPDKNQVTELHRLNTDLLRASYGNVTTFMIKGDRQYGQMVNLAGEQTMLSQRIAAIYGLMSWGFEDKLKTSYTKVEQDFSHNLEILFENLINTPQVDRRLNRVKRQFTRFSRATNIEESVFIPALIDRSAEKMLEDMMDVTNMYADLSSSS